MKTIVSRLFAFVLAFLAIPAFACGDGSCNPPPPPTTPPTCGPTDCAVLGGENIFRSMTNIAGFGGKVEGMSTTAWLMTADLGYNEALESQDFVVSAGQVEVEFKGKDVLADAPVVAGSFVESIQQWLKNSRW